MPASFARRAGGRPGSGNQSVDERDRGGDHINAIDKTTLSLLFRR
jgi:hypothetical protein